MENDNKITEKLTENTNSIKNKNNKGKNILIKALLFFGLIFLGGYWVFRKGISLILLGIMMIIGGFILAGVFFYRALFSQRKIIEKFLGGAKVLSDFGLRASAARYNTIGCRAGNFTPDSSVRVLYTIHSI